MAYLRGGSNSQWAELNFLAVKLNLGYPHFPQPVENPPNEGCHWTSEKRRIRWLYQDLPVPASTASNAATLINGYRRVLRRDTFDLLEGTNGKAIV